MDSYNNGSVITVHSDSLGRKKVSKNKKGNRAGGNRYHARYIKPLGWQKPIHVLFGLNEKSDKEGAGGCVGDGGESQFVCDSKIEESDNTVMGSGPS